jgi:ABC-type xylose transport system substrate-binding protein
MTQKENAISEIVRSIRTLSDEAKTRLGKNDYFNYHPDLQQVLEMILNNDALGNIDWFNVSADLNAANWHQVENLMGKSTNDLRAIIYSHTRNERFSRGHIQSLAASGYMEKWADALEVSQ